MKSFMSLCCLYVCLLQWPHFTWKPKTYITKYYCLYRLPEDCDVSHWDIDFIRAYGAYL